MKKSHYLQSKICILLLYSIIFPILLQAQTWKMVNPVPTIDNLYAVHFLNENTGYVVGDYGIILKTIDGGNSWTTFCEKSSYSEAKLHDVYFYTKDTGYVAESDGIIFNTFDGGENWIKHNFKSDTIISPRYYYREDPYFPYKNYSSYFFNQDSGYFTSTIGIYKKAKSSLYTTIVFPKFDDTNIGTYQNLNSMTFNNNIGYAVGDKGFLLKTTNGTDWSINWLGIAENLTSVYFTGLDTGYVVSDSGKIRKTIDGGKNWTIQMTIKQAFHSIQFVNSKTGYAVGDSGTIVKTTDSGTNWIVLNGGTFYSLNAVGFVNNDTDYCVGNNGTILKSIDNGEKWKIQNSGITKKLYSVDYNLLNTVYAIGDSGSIVSSKLGTEQWNNVSSGTKHTLYSLCFADTNNGFIVGDSGTVLQSNNGGATWNIQSLNTTKQLKKVYFFNKNIGFICGQNTLLKTTNAGKSWNSIPNKYDNIESVYFVDSLVGYLVTWYYDPLPIDYDIYLIHKTIDGGYTWIEQTNSDIPLNSIYFADSSNGYAFGQVGFLKTKDGGNHWLKNVDLLIVGPYRLQSLTFNKNGIGFITGTNGLLLKGNIVKDTIPVIDTTITNITDKNSISILPNPAKSSITIILSNNSELPQGTTADIIDLNGRLLLRQTLTRETTTIDIGMLSAGVYVVKVWNGSVCWVRKFLKE